MDPKLLQLIQDSLQAGASAPAAASAKPTMNVFMGTEQTAGSTRYANKEVGDGMRLPAPGSHSSILDADSASASIYAWPKSKLDSWGKLLVSQGLLKPGYNFSDLVQMWSGAVDEASKLFTIGGKKVTPEKYIEMYASANGLGSGGAAAGKPKTVKQTQTSTNYTDPTTAKAMAQDMLSNLLGRRADDSEVQDYISSLHSAEAANPTSTTTTSKYDASGTMTSSNSVNSGGLDQAGKQEVLQEKVMAKPEYGAFQASSTYFNALQQAIQATAQV